MGNSLAYSLALWAKGKEERIAQLEELQTQCLKQISESKGQQVISSSANGVSVGFAATTTASDMFETVTMALELIARGSVPKKKQAIFPCDHC